MLGKNRVTGLGRIKNPIEYGLPDAAFLAAKEAGARSEQTRKAAEEVAARSEQTREGAEEVAARRDETRAAKEVEEQNSFSRGASLWYDLFGNKIGPPVLDEPGAYAGAAEPAATRPRVTESARAHGYCLASAGSNAGPARPYEFELYLFGWYQSDSIRVAWIIH